MSSSPPPRLRLSIGASPTLANRFRLGPVPLSMLDLAPAELSLLLRTASSDILLSAMDLSNDGRVSNDGRLAMDGRVRLESELTLALYPCPCSELLGERGIGICDVLTVAEVLDTVGEILSR